MLPSYNQTVNQSLLILALALHLGSGVFYSCHDAADYPTDSSENVAKNEVAQQKSNQLKRAVRAYQKTSEDDRREANDNYITSAIQMKQRLTLLDESQRVLKEAEIVRNNNNNDGGGDEIVEFLKSSGDLSANSKTSLIITRPAPTRVLKHSFKDANVDWLEQLTPHSNNASHSQNKQRLKLKQAIKSLQNPHLFGGDMILSTDSRQSLFSTSSNKRANNSTDTKQQHRNVLARAALISDTALWFDGKVYFEIDESVMHIADLILEAMAQFHEHTCIRFEPRPADEPDYLKIKAIRGCFSYIGRIGGEQSLSLESAGCEYLGTIVHELMHAVGFYHHQNRSDRDDYLNILWHNIARGKEEQFEKMVPEDNRLFEDFDYHSIMLYGPRTFGKTLDTVTMTTKRSNVELKEVMEKQGLSSLDIASINKLYKCDEAYY